MISDTEHERCLAAVMAPVNELALVDIVEARNTADTDDDIGDDDFHQAGGHRSTRVVGRPSVSGRKTTTSQPVGNSKGKSKGNGKTKAQLPRILVMYT